MRFLQRSPVDSLYISWIKAILNIYIHNNSCGFIWTKTRWSEIKRERNRVLTLTAHSELTNNVTFSVNFTGYEYWMYICRDKSTNRPFSVPYSPHSALGAYDLLNWTLTRDMTKLRWHSQNSAKIMLDQRLNMALRVIYISQKEDDPEAIQKSCFFPRKTVWSKCSVRRAVRRSVRLFGIYSSILLPFNCCQLASLKIRQFVRQEY